MKFSNKTNFDWIYELLIFNSAKISFLCAEIYFDKPSLSISWSTFTIKDSVNDLNSVNIKGNIDLLSPSNKTSEFCLYRLYHHLCSIQRWTIRRNRHNSDFTLFWKFLDCFCFMYGGVVHYIASSWTISFLNTCDELTNFT